MRCIRGKGAVKAAPNVRCDDNCWLLLMNLSSTAHGITFNL